MAKDIFDISDDAWGTPQEAVKEFTDREDPQEAFERKIRVLNENWKKTFYVLCYYGIGGIGKTSFVNKLCKVIRGVEGNELRLLDKIDCNYIRYDFDAKTAGVDKLSILLSLRKQLGEANKNFKFFRFDSSVLLYVKRSGRNMEKDETAKSLLERNPWLDVAISTVGNMPVVGWVSGVIQAIDKSAKTAKESIGKHMDEARYRYHLNEIDSLEMSELLKKLHEYFVLDMRYNMQQVATKPVIVFLDTYEKYIDTLNLEISMITEDHWLRKGKDSVIRSVPGLLWVITGREKLYWAEDDAWDEPEVECPLSQMSEEEKEELAQRHLEQHLLGDLSEKDATGFLKKAGIVNDTLCAQLYKLTNGTPLFLDICVDTYHDLCSRSIPTEPEQFGEDLTQLISRYLSNMTNENREMTYFLACLGKWNDESVQRIAKKATTLRWYTQARYERFVKHSFIIKNLDGSYYMHETVRSAALKNVDREIKEEIRRIRLSVVKDKVENDTTLSFNTVFEEYIDILAENELSYEEFYENIVFASRQFDSLKMRGDMDVLYTSARKLMFLAKDNYPKTGAEYLTRKEYGHALLLMGRVKEALGVVLEIPMDEKPIGINEEKWISVIAMISTIYDANGMYQESLQLEQRVFTERKRLLGEEHPAIIHSMNNLAGAYYRMGERQKALEMSQQTLELRKRILGEEHPDTFTSMSNLAICYKAIGKKQRALELEEQVLEGRKRILGEEHPDTFTSMSNLAVSYDDIGERQKALELKEQVLEGRKRILGEEHPKTLTSMSNLVASYIYLGEFRRAHELCEQVLDIRKRILGESHPDILDTMNNLAVIYEGLEEYQKALELKEQIVERRKSKFGEGHLDTINAMNNLAILYNKIGVCQKSIELYEQILGIRKQVIGELNPDFLDTMNSLATTYYKIEDYQKAKDIFEQMLEISKRLLGREHADTLSTMNNLAVSYFNIGEKQKALMIYEQIFEIRQKVLGREHPMTKKAGTAAEMLRASIHNDDSSV